MNSKSILNLYYSFVYPLLLYGNIIWGNCAKINLNKLIKLQKLAIRLIMSIRKRDSTNDHFYNLKIIKLEDLYFYNVSIFMYQFHKKTLPPAFDKYFIKNSSCHDIHTRSSNLYRIPLVKQSKDEKFIKKTGVIIWNDLIKKLDIDSPIGMFKNQIKNIIFEKYKSS